MPTRPFAWIDFGNVPGLLDWMGFVLGGIGIGVTLFQLFRSRGALKAASRALIETRASLIKNQLVAILPNLEGISHAVDHAIALDDRDAAEVALEQFCLYANESATLLKSAGEGGEFNEIVHDLLAVSDSAGDARAGLFGHPGETVSDIIGLTASQVRNLAPRIKGTATAVKNDPGKGVHA